MIDKVAELKKEIENITNQLNQASEGSSEAATLARQLNTYQVELKNITRAPVKIYQIDPGLTYQEAKSACAVLTCTSAVQDFMASKGYIIDMTVTLFNSLFAFLVNDGIIDYEGTVLGYEAGKGGFAELVTKIAQYFAYTITCNHVGNFDPSIPCTFTVMQFKAFSSSGFHFKHGDPNNIVVYDSMNGQAVTSTLINAFRMLINLA